MQLTSESVRRNAGGRVALLGVVAIMWVGAVGGGFGFLGWYDQTPGPTPAAPDAWPADSCIQPTQGRYCLVLALHPHCPCSRATLGELEAILSQCGDRLAVHVLFDTPQAFGPDWARTDLWDRAAALPEVTVWCDAGGAEGRKFGAATSGHAALYGPDGTLRFRGGITRGRAQTGDNASSAAVIAHVRGAAGPKRAAVFGCPLETRPNPDASEGEPCTDKK
jgi:hypothetical protein